MRTITINEMAFVNGAGGPASASSAPASASSSAYSTLYNNTNCSVSVPGGVSCSAPLSDEYNAVKEAVESAWGWATSHL